MPWKSCLRDSGLTAFSAQPCSEQAPARGFASPHPLCGSVRQRRITKLKLPALAGSFSLVTPAGFEPAIAGLRTRSPGPLDEGATHGAKCGKNVFTYF